jgi:hypothetical protein
MGEVVRVGGLEYTVLEAEWLPQVQVAGANRVPKERFVVVRMSIRNVANKETSVPLLKLADEEGREFPEVSDLREWSDWLGVLRQIQPGDALNGRVLFDAPTRDMRLEAVDAGDSSERRALIEVPMSLNITPAVPVPGARQ